eukprot:scaffold191600_cov18-Prasinocladus_malaysianus.AAC.1
MYCRRPCTPAIQIGGSIPYRKLLNRDYILASRRKRIRIPIRTIPGVMHGMTRGRSGGSDYEYRLPTSDYLL